MFVRRLAHPFGVEVFDLGMSQLGDSAIKEQLHATLFENLLIIIRNQTLGLAGQVDLTRVFGKPELVSDRRHPKSPFVQEIVSANRPPDAPRSGSQFWHTDGSFRAYPPIATLLASVRIPQIGGETLFADTRSAYEALPSSLLLSAQGLEARFSYHYRLNELHAQGHGPNDNDEQTKIPDVVHPLIRKHPVTGRGSLYLDELCIAGVEAEPGESGGSLLAELFSYALDPERCYRHEWQSGDLLIWDNVSTMHRRGPEHHGERVLHRTTAAGPSSLPFHQDER